LDMCSVQFGGLRETRGVASAVTAMAKMRERRIFEMEYRRFLGFEKIYTF